MVKGEELGLQPIKCINKEGTDKLKDLHVQINDILFAWTYRWVSPQDAKDIYNDLVALGVTLKNLEVSERASLKKLELLEKLRAKVKSVETYMKTAQYSFDDKDKAIATSKYVLSQYLKLKKNGELSDDKVLYLLKETQRVKRNHLRPLTLKTEQMDTLAQELLGIFNDRYVIC